MRKKNLVDNIKRKKSLLCIGLDTDIRKIPRFLIGKYDNPVLEFNKRIIEATSKYAVAYKLNTAFYEAEGVKGWQNLEATINIIPDDIFVIADAKRADIGNTSKMYARAFFENMNSDAVTVAPYMGIDSVSPFLEYKDKLFKDTEFLFTISVYEDYKRLPADNLEMDTSFNIEFKNYKPDLNKNYTFHIETISSAKLLKDKGFVQRLYDKDPIESDEVFKYFLNREASSTEVDEVTLNHIIDEITEIEI